MSQSKNRRYFQSSPEGLFRFLAVSQVLSRTGVGESLGQAVKAVVAQPLHAIDGRLRRVSERSLYRWVSAYRERGQDGLEVKRRCAGTRPKVLSEKLLSFAQSQKAQDPRVSIPQIIARATVLGIIKNGKRVNRVTLYRNLRDMDVAVGLRKAAKRAEARRYAYPHRLQMILCDGKHFRAGVNRAKRVALFFLDDATRRVLDVIVGTSESSALFLEGLHGVVRKFGFFSAIYLDHGAGFIAQDTLDVVASLGSLLIHGSVAYPQGHGKIERFNRTVKTEALRTLDRSPEVDPDCGALTLRLQHYLKNGYNQSPHESLAGETPLARFQRDELPLRFPKDRQDLDSRFVVYLQRRVTADQVVSVESVQYEMPKGYSGSKVILHRQVVTNTIHMLHEGRLMQLHPVNLEANARTRRSAICVAEEPIEHPLPPSAADLSYARDFAPVVNMDGSFPLPSTRES